MPRFLVILEVVWRGATIGSTEDVIEAEDAAEAERLAIEAWQRARPDGSFRPLLTTQH